MALQWRRSSARSRTLFFSRHFVRWSRRVTIVFDKKTKQIGRKFPTNRIINSLSNVFIVIDLRRFHFEFSPSHSAKVCFSSKLKLQREMSIKFCEHGASKCLMKKCPCPQNLVTHSLNVETKIRRRKINFHFFQETKNSPLEKNVSGFVDRCVRSSLDEISTFEKKPNGNSVFFSDLKLKRLVYVSRWWFVLFSHHRCRSWNWIWSTVGKCSSNKKTFDNFDKSNRSPTRKDADLGETSDVSFNG